MIEIGQEIRKDRKPEKARIFHQDKSNPSAKEMRSQDEENCKEKKNKKKGLKLDKEKGKNKNKNKGTETDKS